MSENVNISFIPKKPLARNEGARKHKPVATISFFVSLTIAVVAIGISVMQFLRVEEVEQERIEKIEELRVYNEQLEKDDTIKEIEKNSDFVKRIDIVESLLNRHVASTEIFTFLERTTAKEIRFNDFSFSKTEEGVSLTMGGEATSYGVVAALTPLYRKEKEILKNFTISSFSLTDQGRISFSFTGILDPSLVSYVENYDSN